jgi:LuxR family maltose regulon positive regulatory protein
MVASPDSPLVLTKLRVPTVRPRLIPRSRLVECLSLDTRANLTLVVAPAGYGKSTLLAEWAQSLRQNGQAIAWYALDSSDDDPLPFGAYLVASLAQALGPAAGLVDLAQRLRSSPEMDLQRLLPPVINAVVASERECVLILDDYHLISAPAIHSALAFLLERLPENMHVAIGSRSDPPLPLARLRARGQLLELRTADMRFSEAETATFLNAVMQLDLPPESVSLLEARTEGWVAGLQLAALSLAGRADKSSLIAAFTGSHRYLVDYLLEEVFNRQPAEVQSFLLATSVLERLCAPLCDAMLGGASGSQAILAYLEQANLFVVALDDQATWFRYHHLFGDFLQNRLRKVQPERMPALHRAASDWLAANQFLREAAAHAFQTLDWEYAAAFVEQHSFTMIIHSEISTIYEWCSAFPEEVMRRHPLLCIHQCWAWVFSFRSQNRERVEQRLQQAEQVMATMPDRQLARQLAENAAVVRTFLEMAPDPNADPRQQLALAQATLGTYPEEYAGQFSSLLTIGYAQLALHDGQAAYRALETARQIALRSGLFFGVVESSFHLARLAHSQGRLRRSADICREGQANISAMLAHPEQELSALGCLDVALGCVLLEQNLLDEAEHSLLHGLELLGWGSNPYYLMTAYTALFHLNEIRNLPAQALKCLDSLETAWPDIAFCTGGLRITLALRIAPDDPATLAKAAAWSQAFLPVPTEDLPLPGMGPIGAAETYYIANLAWARAQIALGNLPAARYYLKRQLARAETNALTNRVIEISILEALAWKAAGDQQASFTALGRALAAARAQPEGYLRIFDQGPDLGHLLIAAAQHDICKNYIDLILAATLPGSVSLDRAGASPKPAQSLSLDSGEHLSERELEVLRLMARGASNQAIARQLVITVGTVKSHINHILGKLGASNRTEAVAFARGLGWLDF